MAVIQKLTYIGTTEKPSLWTWKIEVLEETGNVENYTSPVTIKLYIGRTSSAGASYFMGSCKLNYQIGNLTYSENWSKGTRTDIGAGKWYNIGNHTFQVPNIGGPNTLLAKGSINNATFSPYSGSASGNITLDILHTSPIINDDYIITEENLQIKNLISEKSDIVQYLSKKKFDFTNQIIFYDETTLEEINIYYSNNLIGTSKTYIVNTDISNIPFTEIVQIDDKIYLPIDVEVIDKLNGKTTKRILFNIISYFKPVLNGSLTNIKRKTDSQTTLIEDQCNLNIIGNLFKTDTPIGNYNEIIHAYYKIWKDSETEPENYIDVVTSLEYENENFKINNYLIEEIDYRFKYKYKIYVIDKFNNSSEITEGTVATGRAIWTEYSDRVDFYNISIRNEDPFNYKSGDVIDIGGTSGRESYTINGYVSNASKGLYFTILTPKSLANINDIMMESINVEARNINGYINSESGYQEFVGRSGYTIEAYKSSNYSIRVIITKSSAFSNVTNNTPISLNGKIILRLN